MKKTIIFLGMVCMATSAMAFGGGGSGHDSTRYNRHNPGVDNFGVHIHPDNPPLDIRFYDIKNDEHAQPCQAGANVYCCKAGYVVDVATSKCVACPAGSVATLEENFKCIVCEGEMIPNQDKSSCIMPEPTCEGTVCGANCCPTGATCGENNECCIDGTCCPDGGTPIGNLCCKNGVGFDYLNPEYGYSLYVPETCGCPFGGELSSGVCCKNNFHIGLEQNYDSVDLNAPDSYYKTIDVPPCGCPNGGVSLYDEEHDWAEVCCYDGWSLRYGDEWEDKKFDPVVCGCPNGGSLGTDGQTCCKDNLAYNNETQDYTVSKTQVCCEDSGMKWCSGNNTCIDKQDSCPCEGTVCGENCCPTGATCTDGKCCQGEICAEAGQELYCYETNAQGECVHWEICTEGKSTSATGPNAEGTCDW